MAITKAWDSHSGHLALQIVEMILCFLAAIAIHETAHLAVGKLVGLSFNHIRISLFQLDRDFKLSILRGAAADASGWASMDSPKDNAVRSRAILMVLAGPAANLLTAYSIVVLPAPINYFTYSLFIWSLSGGFASLVPHQTTHGVSDGSRALMLLRGGERAERWVALMQVSFRLKQGSAPQDLPPELLAKATAVKDPSADTVRSYILAYWAAYARNDFVKAAECLENCLYYSSRAPSSTRHWVIGNAAVLQVKRNRIDLAEGWLSDLPQEAGTESLRDAVSAAILEAKRKGETVVS